MDYNRVYTIAREFAAEYSESIIVQDTTCETVLIDGTEYPCVPLKLPAKGNAELFERLLQSGACSKMDGCTENGKRYRRVLLWIEPDCSSIRRISEQ